MKPVRTNSDLLSALFRTGVASVKTDGLPEQVKELVEHVKASVEEEFENAPDTEKGDNDVIEVEGQEVD